MGPARAEETGHAPPAPAGPAFVQLAPISIPVINGDRVAYQAGVILTLELAPGLTKADLEEKRRQLTDAFINDLYVIFQHDATGNRLASGQVIKLRMQRVADRVLGPGIVKEVLITRLFEQAR